MGKLWEQLSPQWRRRLQQAGISGKMFDSAVRGTQDNRAAAEQAAQDARHAAEEVRGMATRTQSAQQECLTERRKTSFEAGKAIDASKQARAWADRAEELVRQVDEGASDASDHAKDAERFVKRAQEAAERAERAAEPAEADETEDGGDAEDSGASEHVEDRLTGRLYLEGDTCDACPVQGMPATVWVRLGRFSGLLTLCERHAYKLVVDLSNTLREVDHR